MNIQELIKESYETSKSKGWHDEPRTFGELIALIHSEVSEALEAYREGKIEMTIENGKPEGVVVELADALIRVFDLCGRYGFEIEVFKHGVCHKSSFGENVCNLHGRLHQAWDAHNNGERQYMLSSFVSDLRTVSSVMGLDIESALAAKMAYNKTRPYRHGGKRL